ncbi:hypothetical protein ACIREO_23145 [Streptomyces sp. NPDC102441]|uniref:hypothetical protein n=1 Tax=Streptomyces sp. NPDC102441 TaxID=3366176 RepID=UPI00380A35A5
MHETSSSPESGEMVRLRQLATNETYAQSQQGHRVNPRPELAVPNPSPEQQRWEVQIVELLAEEFGRHQVDAGMGLFGIRSISPYPDRLVIRVDRRALHRWAHALVGTSRSLGSQRLAHLRWSAEAKSVRLVDTSSGAVVTLDRAFPREWQSALNSLTDRVPGVAGAQGAAALADSPYGFEASVLLRRAHLATSLAQKQADVLHLAVRDAGDGCSRLLEVSVDEPGRAACFLALADAPKALWSWPGSDDRRGGVMLARR